jgi:dUTP pyrophosphatase
MKSVPVPLICKGDLIPEYASSEAAGADLKADCDQDIKISAGSHSMVPTGVYLELPRGYEAQVRPRSGLAAKHGVTVLNSPGTIDSDYRGEVRVILINHGKNDFVIKRGDRIAQLVICPVIQADFKIVDTINDTARGSGGFGSTGMN